jgi:hypothetical protein
MLGAAGAILSRFALMSFVVLAAIFVVFSRTST